MSDFIKHQSFEAEVKTIYGIDSEIFYKSIDSNNYEIKISYNGKDAVIHECMKNGLTKHVILTTDKTVMYKKYHEAEQDAIEYLKG